MAILREESQVVWRRWGIGMLVAGAVLAGAPPAAGTSPMAAPAERVPDLEAFLVERMRATETPGLSYALVHGDEVVAARGWGTDGFGRPMSAHTPVGFGSVSKPVTATAVLRLVDAGVVGLDDPVVRHLPWFRLADQAHARRITVRHLLDQTSGISARDGYDRSDLDDNAPGAIRRWVGSLADVTPTAAPGERHQYSPANATILAAMIEEVTGRSFADHLRREVFGPLRMADTIADARQAQDMPPGFEYYFGAVRTAERTFDTSGLAYGYVAGSVTDLAHLAIPLLNHGRYRGREFLENDTVETIRTGGPKAAGGRYGLGWRVTELSTVDTRIVWHAGAVAGYHTVLIAAPDAGWAVAVQQNVYSPLRDEALNHAAFGALTIALGGSPGPPPDDSAHTVALVGLGALVVVLAGGLVLTVRRPGRRAVLAAAAWGGFGAVAAVGVGWVLPASFDLRLRHIVRFMPDVGHLAVAVVGLGWALVAARVVTALVRPRRRSGSPEP